MNGLQARFRVKRQGFELDAEFLAPSRGVTVLFGPSGSGKTTLLRCVAGLTRAPEGYLALNDECWQDEACRLFVPAHERPCGYVFQEANLFAHLSVRRNLEYGLKRVPVLERRASFEETVELLGLAPLLARETSNLSGGERQRVAMARALLSSPRILLMDEPLASLDATRKGEILYYIERLRDESGVPILYVSHSIDEVVRLADKVVTLANGKVTAAGTVQETIGRDEGSAVVEATVVAQDLESGLARLDFGAGDLFTSDLDALPGERVRVRISARDVALSLSRPRDTSFLNILPAIVTSVAHGGGASVDVHLNMKGTALVARITRKSAHDLSLAPGLPVFALVKAVAIDRHSVGYA